MKFQVSEYTVAILCVALAVSILIFDIYEPLGVSVGLLYITVILLGVWTPWKYHIYRLALAATVLIILGYFLSEHLVPEWIALTNRLLSVSIIWIAAFLITRLEKSARLQHTIVETAIDGIITINEAGRIESFNPAAERIFGYPAADVIGQDITVLLPPYYYAEHDNYIRNYVTTGEKKAIGKRLVLEGRRRDNSIFPLELTVGEAQYEDSRYFVGIVHDISTRKNMEDTLRQEHQFNKKLIDTARAIILTLDTEGRIVHFNRYMEELSGYRLEEVKGMDWFEKFIPEDEKTTINKVFYKAISGTRTDGNINHIMARDGQLYLIEWFDNPLTDSEGNITGIMAIGQDITERIKVRDELSVRTRQLTALIQLDKMALSETHQRPLIEFAIHSLIEILKADYANMVELIPDENLCKMYIESGTVDRSIEYITIPVEQDSMIHYTLQTNEPVIVEDLHADERFEKIFILDKLGLVSGVCVLVGTPENPLGVLCIYMKVKHVFTEDEINFVQSVANTLAFVINRIQVESRTQRLQQGLANISRISAIGHLGAAISHEINQPLTALINYVSSCRRLLQNKYQQLPVDIDMLMSKTIDEAERTASITRHLRDYIESGVIYRKDENINKIIYETCELFRMEADENNIKILFELDQDLPHVYVDKIQIQQIVTNLLRNSITALEQVVKRKIMLSTKTVDENYIEVSVQDSGPGTSPDILDYEFKAAYSNKKGGLGLGLSICKTIIDAHGGKLRYIANPAGGSIFSFTVPVVNNINKNKYE